MLSQTIDIFAQIVRLRDVFAAGGAIVLCFDYKICDLADILSVVRRPLDEDEIRQILWMLLSGVAFCHCRGILHRVCVASVKGRDGSSAPAFLSKHNRMKRPVLAEQIRFSRKRCGQCDRGCIAYDTDQSVHKPCRRVSICELFGFLCRISNLLICCLGQTVCSASPILVLRACTRPSGIGCVPF